MTSSSMSPPTSSPGLPSAHPAAYVPVTLVEVPREHLLAAARPVSAPGVPRAPRPAVAGARDLPSRARPGTVTAAGILWVLLATADAAFALVLLATGGTPVPVALLALGLGVATAALAVLLLDGRDTRIAVTVLGGLAGAVVLPALLLFLPGLVLTLHPSSTAWFDR